jgi:hypothetical protein
VGSVQPSNAIVTRLLVAGLAALQIATSGCGSGSGASAQAPPPAPGSAVPAAQAVTASPPAGSLADVRRRLVARGYSLEYGFPSGQATDAVTVTDSPGVDISGFEDPVAALVAFESARRLLQLNSGTGLIELHAGTRLYMTSLPRPLSRDDRRHFHDVVAAGEGAV